MPGVSKMLERFDLVHFCEQDVAHGQYVNQPVKFGNIVDPITTQELAIQLEFQAMNAKLLLEITPDEFGTAP
jgi:hypothetical protein